MATIDFRALEQAALRLRQAASEDDMAPVLAEGGRIVLDALRAEAPARGGRLRRSLQARGVGLGVGFFAVSYARFVVMGTAPHLIRPRTGRALSWPGAAHPVALVRHPGTKANDFPRRAVRQAEPALRAALLAAGRTIAEGIAEG